MLKHFKEEKYNRIKYKEAQTTHLLKKKRKKEKLLETGERENHSTIKLETESEMGSLQSP